MDDYKKFKEGDLIVVDDRVIYLLRTSIKMYRDVYDDILSAIYLADVDIEDGTLDIDYDGGKFYLSTSSNKITKATDADRDKFIRLLKENGSKKAGIILKKYFSSKDKKGGNKNIYAILMTIAYILIGTASIAFVQFVVPIFPCWLKVCGIVLATLLLYSSIRKQIE